MPIRTSHPEVAPSWVDLATTDPSGARAFYGALFGWSFDINPIEGGGEYVMATKGGHSAAGIFQQPQDQIDVGLPPLWSVYVTVSDVDEVMGRVTPAGGRVYMQPFEVMTAGRMGVVGDPTGAGICLWQPRDSIGAELVGEPGAFFWAELHTSADAAASAADFYAAVLGWESTSASAGPLGPTSMFVAAGSPVASAVTVPADQGPPHWQVYFGVEDCHAACETVIAAGGAVVLDPIDTPPGPIAVMTDPAGAAFSVVGLG